MKTSQLVKFTKLNYVLGDPTFGELELMDLALYFIAWLYRNLCRIIKSSSFYPHLDEMIDSSSLLYKIVEFLLNLCDLSIQFGRMPCHFNPHTVQMSFGQHFVDAVAASLSLYLELSKVMNWESVR